MTSAAPSRIARPRALEPYENWRPPIIGVSVLAPVGATGLILPCIFGDIPLLPTGAVEEGQSPEEAAQAVLTGLPGGLPIRRRVAVDQVQMRRRKVITHLVATESLTVQEANALAYRDARAQIRVFSTTQAIHALPERSRRRVLLGLQALAIGAMVDARDSDGLEVVLPSSLTPV
ncbi:MULTISPECIES: hypothetical protein [unclassified Streptomyces]|uniref:hypothetical protein n=1 Tax=unclassified Streptomyces TaxID=2593676 RepID=UPI001BB01BF7|nr:hypothetical protein [Streptomyces sp. V17-9]QUW89899.1 hypothetical protein KE639_01075 [Streptomyces sp. V17-9]